MTSGWEYLPLLPLRCVLDHLSVSDALAAMSTCRHWRTAMLLYEGHRESLTIRASELEENLLLSRVFRKHVQTLHVYLDCRAEELDKFINFVLSQFFDSLKLKEILFIGPMFMNLSPLTTNPKLNRIITESLVFKNSRFIEKLALMGCEMGTMTSENDRYVHKQVEYFSAPLASHSVTSPMDNVLSRCNVNLMMFSPLKHIILDYDQVSTESLETMSQLANFTQLTMNVTFERGLKLSAVDWQQVNMTYGKRLDVAVNIISVPAKKLQLVMENILVEGINLVSFKVMFCQTVNKTLLKHICRLYQRTLRELVWVDCPYDGYETDRFIRLNCEQMYVSDAYDQVNPFILLCWQCEQLRRLVIHGYWIWPYDVSGFLRLRRRLRVEVSAVSGAAPARPTAARRLLRADRPPRPLTHRAVKEINHYTNTDWKPTPWRQLHSALRHNSTPERRAEYVVNEVLHPLGVT